MKTTLETMIAARDALEYLLDRFELVHGQYQADSALECSDYYGFQQALAALRDAIQQEEAGSGDIHLTRAQYDDIIKAMRHDGQLVCTLRAEVEVLEVYRKRLEWLHTGGGPADYDKDGYEWGVYRVKYDAYGKLLEAWQTLSDYSDLDQAMAEHQTRPANTSEGRT